MKAMKRIASLGVVLFCACSLAPAEEAEIKWKEYKSERYGFSMLIPEGTTITENESRDGAWGELTGDYDGVKIWVIAKLGAPESLDAIEAEAEKLFGYPSLTKESEGRNQQGFTAWRDYHGTSGGNVIECTIGTGPMGNYAICIQMSQADHDESAAELAKFDANIRALKPAPAAAPASATASPAPAAAPAPAAVAPTPASPAPAAPAPAAPAPAAPAPAAAAPEPTK